MRAQQLIRIFLVRFLAVALIPLILMTLYVGQWLLPKLHAEQAGRIRASSLEVARATEWRIQAAKETFSAFVRSSLDGRMGLAPAQQVFRRFIGATDVFEAVYWVDARGVIQAIGARDAAREGLMLGMDLSRADIFTRFLQSPGASPSWSDVFHSIVTGRQSLALLWPWGNSLIVAELDVDVLSRIARYAASSDIDVMILDRHGVLIGHRRAELSNQQLNLSQLPVFNAAHQDELTSFMLEGASYVGLAHRSLTSGWWFVAYTPEDRFLVSSRRATFAFWGVVAFALVLSGGLAWRVAGGLRERFASTADVAERFAQGDYDVRIEPSHVREIDRMLSALENMGQAIRQREAEREMERERLTQFLEHVPHIAVQWFNCKGEILYWNTASETMMGYSRQNALGRTLDELIFTPAEQADFLTALTRVSQSGEASGVIETRFFRKGHESGTMLYALFPVPDAGDEPIIGAAEVDISSQKTAELALAERELRYRALIEQSPVGIIELDLQGVILAMNPAARRVLIQGGDEKETMPFEVMLQASGTGFDQLFTELKQVADSGQLRDIERPCRIRGKARTLCFMATRLTHPSGDAMGYLILMEDVTTQREAERELYALNRTLEQRVAERTRELEESLEQLQRAQAKLIQTEKMASLGELVAGVAHELNTPIGNSLMAATTLRDHVQEMAGLIESGRVRKSELQSFLASTRTASDLVSRNLERAADLISSFKQVAVDQSSVQRRRFELREVVNEIRMTLHPLFKRTRIHISVELEDGLVMDSYPGPLGQVLTNLLTNAQKHAFEPDQPGHILIQGRLNAPETVELVIEDDGRGMDETVLKRIFDPFFTTALGEGGSGLGMHLVYQLTTELLGGHIDVQSCPGKGSRFTLTLPVQAPGTST